MTVVADINGASTEFQGQRVLVIGGSRGIGAAMVRRFLGGGATVAAVARTKPDDAADYSGPSDDDGQNILAGNLLAAVRLDRSLVPGMADRGVGVVLHVGTFTHRLV